MHAITDNLARAYRKSLNVITNTFTMYLILTIVIHSSFEAMKSFTESLNVQVTTQM